MNDILLKIGNFASTHSVSLAILAAVLTLTLLGLSRRKKRKLKKALEEEKNLVLKLKNEKTNAVQAFENLKREFLNVQNQNIALKAMNFDRMQRLIDQAIRVPINIGENGVLTEDKSAIPDNVIMAEINLSPDEETKAIDFPESVKDLEVTPDINRLGNFNVDPAEAELKNKI